MCYTCIFAEWTPFASHPRTNRPTPRSATPPALCGCSPSSLPLSARCSSPPLPPLSLGSKLLRQILEYAESHSDIAEVYLHVQVSNTEALDFYSKQGFENVGKIENYYKKIDPPDCFVVSKKYVHVSMVGSSIGSSLD